LAKEREAHSDDELVEIPNLDTSTVEQVYHINKKEGRAEKVTNFYRKLLDTKRRRMAQSKGTHHKLTINFFSFLFSRLTCFSYRQERLREVPVPSKVSRLTKLPKKVPIDWFEPAFWNDSLTLRERASYIKDGIHVALPLEEFCGTWEKCAEWKNLSDKEFMEKYGDDVLKDYNILTAEELEQLEKLQEDGEEEEVENDLDLTDGDD
jgi:hypothetical protein